MLALPLPDSCTFGRFPSEVCCCWRRQPYKPSGCMKYLQSTTSTCGETKLISPLHHNFPHPCLPAGVVYSAWDTTIRRAAVSFAQSCACVWGKRRGRGGNSHCDCHCNAVANAAMQQQSTVTCATSGWKCYYKSAFRSPKEETGAPHFAAPASPGPQKARTERALQQEEKACRRRGLWNCGANTSGHNSWLLPPHCSAASLSKGRCFFCCRPAKRCSLLAIPATFSASASRSPTQLHLGWRIDLSHSTLKN